MKILAIRGRNLASLARSFEVDFTQQPLATTGIFAITGPTGAGKSTLLDALCLALYDDTPRLLRAVGRGISLPDVQGETVAPHDTRSILRRGAAEGFAEVDFVGNDALGYRARWSVRRARNKSAGRLQSVEMTLLQLPELQAVGGTLKTEVLTAIHERIGLSFEQFTRAVLLAQNEFAAFLKASDRERAELLENLTGTRQFSQLSRLAFERARAERQQLQALRDQSGLHAPLSAELRIQLEAEIQTAQQAKDALACEQAQLEEQLRWHTGREALQSRWQQAQADVEQALLNQQAALPRQQALAMIEAVQAAREYFMSCERQQREQGAAEQQLTQAHQALQTADAAMQTCIQRQAQLEHCRDKAEAARQHAEPELVAARELDTQIQTLQPGHHKARLALNKARLDCQQINQQLTGQNEALQTQQAALQISRDWLAAHDRWQAVGESWAHWSGLLTQAEQGWQAVLGTQQAQREQQTRLEQQQQAQALAQQVFQDREQAHDRLQLALQQAEQALQAFAADDMVDTRQWLDAEREQLHVARQCWQTHAQADKEQQTLQARQQALQHDLARDTAALADAQRQLPVVESALQQAERSQQLAKAASQEQVGHLRTLLVDGEACPVCGAAAHPFAHQSPVFDGLLDSLDREVEQQRAAEKALHRQITSLETSLELSGRQQDETGQALQQLTAALKIHALNWQQQAVYPEVLASADPAQWFANASDKLEQNLRAWAVQEQAWRAARQQVDALQQQYRQLEKDFAAARSAVQQAGMQVRELEQEIKALAERLALQQAHWQAAAGALQPVFAAGGDAAEQLARWQLDPAVWVMHCQTQARDWLDRQQQALVQQQAVQDLQAGIQQLQAEAARAGRDLAAQEQAFHLLDQDMQARAQRRKGLLDGRDVSVVEQALTAAMQTARQDLDAHQPLVQLAQTTQAGAQEARRQAEKRCQHAAGQLQSAQQVLAGWLQAYNQQHDAQLTSTGLAELLARDADWIRTETLGLQALQATVTRAETLRDERQQALEAHLQAHTAAEIADPLQLQAQRQEVNQQLQQAQGLWQELQLKRRQDEQHRERFAALGAEIERQESQWRIWEQLNELIGSAKGEVFRDFAQQYSLDVLLAYANRHLGDLSRRYVLQRVPDTLALMVEDRDMGSESRSVHSLSGGEAFLVSLALALGLAFLSSHRVRVESLFIDEGFGSLDADSLGIAMDALDNLQAQGRKVGVISHVQEMTERIGVQIQVKRLSGGQSRLDVV